MRDFLHKLAADGSQSHPHGLWGKIRSHRVELSLVGSYGRKLRRLSNLKLQTATPALGADPIKTALSILARRPGMESVQGAEISGVACPVSFGF